MRSARRARAAPRPGGDWTIAAPDLFTIERAARCAFAPPARRRATRIPGRVCRAAGGRTPFRVHLAAAWRTHRRRAPNRATFLWRPARGHAIDLAWRRRGPAGGAPPLSRRAAPVWSVRARLTGG